MHRLETLNAYLASAEEVSDRRGFRAYAICDACGQVRVFTDGELCRDLQRWMDGQAFTLRRSTIELHGCCAKCSANCSAQAGQPRRSR